MKTYTILTLAFLGLLFLSVESKKCNRSMLPKIHSLNSNLDINYYFYFAAQKSCRRDDECRLGFECRSKRCTGKKMTSFNDFYI